MQRACCLRVALRCPRSCVCSLAAQRSRAACVQPCVAHSAQLRAHFAGPTSCRSRLRVETELAERVLTELAERVLTELAEVRAEAASSRASSPCSPEGAACGHACGRAGKRASERLARTHVAGSSRQPRGRSPHYAAIQRQRVRASLASSPRRARRAALAARTLSSARYIG